MAETKCGLGVPWCVFPQYFVLFINKMVNAPWLYLPLMAGWCWFMHAWSQPIYQMLNSMCGEFIAGPAVSTLFHMCFYHGTAALHALMDKFPEGPWSLFKAHRRDTHKFMDILPRVLFNQVCLYTAVSAGTFWLSGGRGQLAAGDPPTALQYAYQCVVHYLLYETFFYWTHRAMHHRLLYAHHRLHHSTKTSLGITGLYTSPLDFLITQALPVLLPPIVAGSHVFVCWMYTPIVAINSAHSHSSYHFPGLPNPHEHSEHHRLFSVAYGTGPWDYIMGTCAPPPPPPPPHTGS